MPLTVEDTGDDISRVGTTNSALRRLCAEAIEDADVHFAGREPPARITADNGRRGNRRAEVRIDIQGVNQGPDRDQTNIQIQIGSNSVAFIMVSRSAITCPTSPSTAKAAAEAAATAAIQEALTGSLASQTKWTVTGAPP